MLSNDLNKILIKNGKLTSSTTRIEFFKNNYPNLLLEIEKYSINNNLKLTSFKEKLYHALHDKTEIPKCEVCGNKIPSSKFMGIMPGYSSSCSRKCAIVLKEKRTRITVLKRYGVQHITQSNYFKDKYYFPFAKEKLKDKIKIIEWDDQQKIKIECVECKSISIIDSQLLYRRINININPCLKCNPNHGKSNSEIELIDWIKDIYLKPFRINSKKELKNRELDIYIEDKNIAFEHNGVYWHNEFNKPKEYHIDKSNRCKELGINLIHIWEDVWYNKRDIVKSRIKNLLNLSTDKVYARKCVIKTVNSGDSREFLNRNHLQGNTNAAIKLGLYYEGELVSLMTFGSLRKNLNQVAKENEWELLRFANKLNTSVVGGASRLFKYFIKEYKPERVVSYADCDWTVDEQDNLYTKLGFEYIVHTGLNYWWVVDGIRENRFKYRKDKLVKEGADSLMTEVEIMHDKGYYRCFGTGNYKFEWKLK